jgi:putative flippase GtrA
MSDTSRRRLTRQFSTFTLVGVFGTIAHYAVMAALVEGFGVHPVPATAAGFLSSAILSYALNYRITFASSMDHRRALPMFLLVGSVGLALNAMLVGLLTGPAHLHWLLAQAMATATVLCWNFAANRRWTFAADFQARPAISRAGAAGRRDRASDRT